MVIVFFQAEDGIRDLVRARGLGDVYKRQDQVACSCRARSSSRPIAARSTILRSTDRSRTTRCLLYTSDAADERSSVDLGGRRIIKKKKQQRTSTAM